MTRRLLRANVILESIAKVYVDVPDDMDIDDIDDGLMDLLDLLGVDFREDGIYGGLTFHERARLRVEQAS